VLDAKTGVYDESKNTLEKVETMRTFNSPKEMPKHALKPGTRVSFR
jgi:hypothetical protein